MDFLKKGVICLLAASMAVPSVPVSAASKAAEPVSYDIGTGKVELDADAYDDEGNYEIVVEDNAFFPYEVQFTVGDETTTEWFMTPDDAKEVAGHEFTVASESDGTVITRMTLDVAGEEVVVYPAEKFDNSAQIDSLLPLEERELTVDLTGFTPIELTKVSTKQIFVGDNALENTDKIAWTQYYDDDYEVSESGDRLDLSVDTASDETMSWEMIVGDADQLNMKNIRYFVNVRHSITKEWLTGIVKNVDAKGKKTSAEVKENDYRDYSASGRTLYVRYKSEKNVKSKRIGLELNEAVFPSTGYSSIKVFEGEYESAAAAEKGKDITKKIWNKCNYEIQQSNRIPITIVAYDDAGNAVGCLPFAIWLSGISSNGDTSLNGSMHYRGDGENVNVSYDYEVKTEKTDDIQVREYEYKLYKEYEADRTYSFRMRYLEKGKEADVTAAYLGQYKSIAAAKKADAEDVKDDLFSADNQSGGYSADYSKSVWFTVFVGEDGDEQQDIYQCQIKALTGTVSILSNDTDCEFTGVVSDSGNANSGNISNPDNDGYTDYGDDSYYDSEYDYGYGNRVKSYKVDSDSYAEMNFITFFVGKDADLSHLALEFYVYDNAKLYAEGSNTPEESGKSFHDFSKGAIQFTVSSESGQASKSYWVRIVKAKEGAGELYVNSLSDPSAKTTVKNGTINTTREVMLDGYHSDVHDIMVANIGAESIPNLSVQLKSDVVELDKYWTLSGKNDLLGLETLERDTRRGELQDLAMVRLKAKSGVEYGTDVSGTLTFKSGKKTLMVMNLTGTVGDPVMTTKKVPKAVKYVPYGSMIQNSNKYSWNQVSYKLVKGKLPKGMTLKENGEIYGVPKKAGTYKFTVEMSNSYEDFITSRREFTLKVVENTDKNVDGATDKGYKLSKRISDINTDTSTGKSYLMVSNGEFGNFVDVYLDGKKLKKKTDYNAKEGSTRITIKTQALTKNKTYGTHTIGIEFRDQKTNDLKKAAQNYNVTSKKNGITGGSTPAADKKPDTGKGSTDAKPDNGGGTAENKPDNNQTVADKKPESNHNVDVDSSSKTYKVQSGDTLWSIAAAKYGDGSKWRDILEANRDIIPTPPRMPAGITIRLP